MLLLMLAVLRLCVSAGIPEVTIYIIVQILKFSVAIFFHVINISINYSRWVSEVLTKRGFKNLQKRLGGEEV